jgi:hypothetical protein
MIARLRPGDRRRWMAYSLKANTARLGLKYRVIYRLVAKDQLFQVVSITAHDYRRPSR